MTNDDDDDSDDDDAVGGDGGGGAAAAAGSCTADALSCCQRGDFLTFFDVTTDVLILAAKWLKLCTIIHNWILL